MFKLIRDSIPEIMQKEGKVCNHAVVQNKELFNWLLRGKLVEEINEFLMTGTLDELVDVQLVINTLVEDYKEEFETIYAEKLKVNGGFSKKYVGFFDDPKPEQEAEQGEN